MSKSYLNNSKLDRMMTVSFNVPLRKQERAKLEALVWDKIEESMVAVQDDELRQIERRP